MKHRILRSFAAFALIVMMVATLVPALTLVTSAEAEGDGVKYTFSEYTAGTQYAENEEHVLDDRLTVTTTEAHFTSELRLYSSSAHDGYAIFKSSKKIESIVINAGNKADTLNVYQSNDGTTWTLVQGVTTTTAYADHTVDFDGGTEYIKFDVAGTQQVRIKYVTVTYAVCPHTNTTSIGTAKDATCTEDGITAGKKCTDCGEKLEEQKTIEALGHKDENPVDSKCDTCGSNLCTEHKWVDGEVKTEGNCTTDRVVAQICENCGEPGEDKTTTAPGHTEVTDAAVAATCIATGFTEGKHCDVCGEVLVAQTEVAMIAHNYVNGICSVCQKSQPAKYALVTDIANLDAGNKIIIVCTSKNMAMGAQNSTYRSGVAVTIVNETIEAPDGLQVITLGGSSGAWTLGVSDTAYLTYSGSNNTLTTGDSANTWTISIAADGVATIKHGTLTSRQIQWNASNPRFACYTSEQTEVSIFKLVCDHTNTAAIGDAKDATCTEDGITAGEKCTDCGEVLEDQKTIEALGHNFVDGVCTREGCGKVECDHIDKGVTLGEVTKQATCIGTGLQEQFCAQCGQPLDDLVLEMVDHTPATDAAVAPTCTKTGLTEGSHCSVCNEVLVEQTVVDMVAHDYVDGKCSKCGDVVVNGDKLAEFQFGENVTAGSHSDGSKVSSDKTYQVGGYDLNLTSPVNVYEGNDKMGNSALKLGTSSAAASFSFTVPDNVNTVVFYIAGYKTNTAKVNINGTEYEITTTSDVGNYTKVVVNTTTNKTVTLETLSGGYRAMINSIEFWGEPVAPTPTLDTFGATLNKGVTIKVTYTIDAAWLASNLGAKVVFSNGEEIPAVAGKNAYTVELTPAEINDDLTVALQLADGTPVIAAKDVSLYTYWYKLDEFKSTYAELGLTEAKYNALVGLVEKALEYSDAVDAALAGETVPAPAVEFADDEASFDGDAFQSFSGVLREYASVYLKLKENAITDGDKITVTRGGVTLVENGNAVDYLVQGQYIVIENLYPLNFDDEIVVTITTSSGTSTAKFNFNSYLSAVYNADGTSESVKNVVANTYLYGVAAEAYKNVQ